MSAKVTFTGTRGEDLNISFVVVLGGGCNSTHNRYQEQLGMFLTDEGRERATDWTNLPYSTYFWYHLIGNEHRLPAMTTNYLSVRLSVFIYLSINDLSCISTLLSNLGSG